MSSFDLYANITKNVAFRNKINKLMGEFHLACKSKNKVLKSQLFNQILLLCQGNPSLLMPYFFPDFHRKKPLSLITRPYAFYLGMFSPGGFSCIRSGRQVGKCPHGNTKLKLRNSNGLRYEDTIENVFLLAKRSRQEGKESV